MIVSEEKLEEEIEWQKHLNDKHRDLLQNGEVVQPQIPSSHSMIAKTSRNIGLCKLTQNKEAGEWFSTAAEKFMTKIDKIDQLGDEVEGSHRAHRPYDIQNMLYSAILSGNKENIQRAIDYGDELDEKYLNEHTDFEHLYLHVKALNEYLKGEKSEAENFLDRLDAFDLNKDYANYYRSLSTGLRGLIDSDLDEFLEGLNNLLEYHDRDNELSTASDFISVEASTYIKLADREGLDVKSEDIEEKFRDYIPEKVLN